MKKATELFGDLQAQITSHKDEHVMQKKIKEVVEYVIGTDMIRLCIHYKTSLRGGVGGALYTCCLDRAQVGMHLGTVQTDPRIIRYSHLKVRCSSPEVWRECWLSLCVSADFFDEGCQAPTGVTPSFSARIASQVHTERFHIHCTGCCKIQMQRDKSMSASRPVAETPQS